MFLLTVSLVFYFSILLFLYWQCLFRDPLCQLFCSLLLLAPAFSGFNFLLTEVCQNSFSNDCEYSELSLCENVLTLFLLLNDTELFSFSILKPKVCCLPVFLVAFENSAYSLIFLCN